MVLIAILILTIRRSQRLSWQLLRPSLRCQRLLFPYCEGRLQLSTNELGQFALSVPNKVDPGSPGRSGPYTVSGLGVRFWYLVPESNDSGTPLLSSCVIGAGSTTAPS